MQCERGEECKEGEGGDEGDDAATCSVVALIVSAVRGDGGLRVRSSMEVYFNFNYLSRLELFHCKDQGVFQILFEWN